MIWNKYLMVRMNTKTLFERVSKLVTPYMRAEEFSLWTEYSLWINKCSGTFQDRGNAIPLTYSKERNIRKFVVTSENIEQIDQLWSTKFIIRNIYVYCKHN